ncbi:hypothetical protein M422DRAFT_154636, partial [Sphaerobolus stellatus SS14]
SGPVKCCNVVGKATDPAVVSQAGNLLAAAIQGITATVGLGCTNVPVIAGAVGPNCAQQPVCCEGNNFNGLVNIGCTPVSA